MSTGYIALAQEEARRLNHDLLSTELILLGLIREDESVAAKALESLGIALEDVRQQVEEIIGQGQQAPSGHVRFTLRAAKMLELSLPEALQLGHNYIGTEHVLLSLIREGESIAAQVLVKLGADLNRVYQQVLQLVPSGPPGQADDIFSWPALADRQTASAGQESPDASQIEQGEPRTIVQAVNRKLGKPRFKVDGGFYGARDVAAGGASYTEVIVFLGQAALAGVVGNALYDGIRSTVRSIARRWQARRKLSDEDVAELMCVAVRLRLQVDAVVEALGDDLAVEEVTKKSDGTIDARIGYLNSNDRWHVSFRGVTENWPIDDVTTVWIWCFSAPERRPFQPRRVRRARRMRRR